MREPNYYFESSLETT